MSSAQTEPLDKDFDFYEALRENRIERPWQVRIGYDRRFGFSLHVYMHSHGSIAFSSDAAKACGGTTAWDEDGYVIACVEEPKIAGVARWIARMSDPRQS